MSKFNSEIFKLEEDIKVFCVTADSFPEGILKAHETLHKMASPSAGREYFGISWGGKEITYKAAANELYEGELENKGLEEFVIRKGKYISSVVNNPEDVKHVLQELLTDSRIDPDGYCVEMYLSNDEIRCMVTLRP